MLFLLECITIPNIAKVNPTSNLSRGLQMSEHKPEAVLGQARSETKKC